MVRKVMTTGLLAFVIISAGCYIEKTSIDLKVISLGVTFSGYYIVDGGSIINISGAGSDPFIFESNVNMDTSIHVHASTSGTSIEVLIFENGDLVKSAQDNSENPSITLDYSFDEGSGDPE
jgi:hypothetical protein